MRAAIAERGGCVTLTTRGGLGHLGTAINDVALLNGNPYEHEGHSEEVCLGRSLIEEQKSEHCRGDGQKRQHDREPSNWNTTHHCLIDSVTDCAR